MKYTEETINTARDLYKELKSLRKVSRLVNIPRNVLTELLKESGAYIQPSCRDLKPVFNEGIFNSIDTEEKAYWIGFLEADGYLSQQNSLRLELAEKDLGHIIKFCVFLNYPVSRITYRGDRNTYFINISSLKLAKDLKKLKLKDEKYPLKDISKAYIRHYIRGFFDGDGSVYGVGKTSFNTSIIAKIEYLKSFSEYLPLSIFKYRKVNSASVDIYRLETKSIIESLKLSKYIYDNSTIYLERKYEKYLKYNILLGKNFND